MPVRKLKGLSGSQNEQDELALILAKRKDPFIMCKNMYGSEAVEIFKDPVRKNRFLVSVGFTPENEEQLEQLENKVKEEREHNEAFEAETKKQFAEQQRKTKIKEEESGYQTI